MPDGLPDTPTGPTLSNVLTTSIEVAWNAVSNTISYDVQYDTTILFTSPTTQNVTGITTTLNFLSADTTYYVRIRAVNNVGNGGWSTSVSATTASVVIPLVPDPTTSTGRYLNRIYECVTGGTTSPREVEYSSTISSTITDGTAVFRAHEAWTRSASVISVRSNREFNIIVEEPRLVDGWYTDGSVVFETGDNVGVVHEIRNHIGNTITLQIKTSETINIGDQLRIAPGCDKRPVTCQGKFRMSITHNFSGGNIDNFRGEPYVPTVDLRSTTIPTPRGQEGPITRPNLIPKVPTDGVTVAGPRDATDPGDIEDPDEDFMSDVVTRNKNKDIIANIFLVDACSDGTTIWALSETTTNHPRINKVLAFRASDFRLDYSKIIETRRVGWTTLTNTPTHIYLVDSTRETAYCWLISDLTRVPAKDITLGAGEWHGAEYYDGYLYFLDNLTNTVKVWNETTKDRDETRDIEREIPANFVVHNGTGLLRTGTALQVIVGQVGFAVTTEAYDFTSKTRQHLEEFTFTREDDEVTPGSHTQRVNVIGGVVTNNLIYLFSSGLFRTPGLPMSLYTGHRRSDRKALAFTLTDRLRSPQNDKYFTNLEYIQTISFANEIIGGLVSGNELHLIPENIIYCNNIVYDITTRERDFTKGYIWSSPSGGVARLRGGYQTATHFYLVDAQSERLIVFNKTTRMADYDRNIDLEATMSSDNAYNGCFVIVGNLGYLVNVRRNYVLLINLTTREIINESFIQLPTGTYRPAFTNGTTLWFGSVAQGVERVIFRAYTVSNASRDQAKDLALPAGRAIVASNTDTLWVLRERVLLEAWDIN